MTDLEKAELRNWIMVNRGDWQRVQAYVDMRIEEIGKDCIEYAVADDLTELKRASGKIEVLKEVRDLQAVLEQ